jgi:hypothetical protein
MQQIYGNIQNGMPPPPGFNVTPHPLDPSKIMVASPEEGLQSIMSPEAAEARRADIEERTHGPSSPRARATRDLEIQREQAKATEAENQRQSNEARTNATNDSRERIALGNQAALMNKAMLQMAAQNGYSPEDIKYAHEQAVNGELSDVQAKRDYGKSYPLLVKAMNASGSNFYTPKQQELGAKMAGGISLLSDMQRVNDLLKEGIYTHPENLIEALRLGAQVKEKLISTLGILGQGSRLAESRVKAVVDAYGAALVVGGVKSNTQAMKSYRDLLTDVAKENLQGLKPHQINSWLAQRGLLNKENAIGGPKSSETTPAPMDSVAPEKQKALTDILGPAFAGVSPGGQ